MNKIKKELELLKSWGIESVSIDKILGMIDEVGADEDVITGEDCVGASYPPCKEESSIDAPFKGIASKIITAYPVGGRIFYIDDTADGIYEFFDADGNPIKTIQVGDRPYYYRVIKKGSKDKYYVYHDEIYNNMRWTYCREEIYVHESLNTSAGIGSGKTNTEKVMAKDGGAYITADSYGLPTIWYRLQQVRNAKVGGCDDWFVPSVNEAERLRKAIKLGNITGGIIAGSSYNWSMFKSKRLWSSNEYLDSYACLWQYDGQYWDFSSKGNNYSVFFVRAF